MQLGQVRRIFMKIERWLYIGNIKSNTVLTKKINSCEMSD